mgnify:CR=1 FL=1
MPGRACRRGGGDCDVITAFEPPIAIGPAQDACEPARGHCSLADDHAALRAPHIAVPPETLASLAGDLR